MIGALLAARSSSASTAERGSTFGRNGTVVFAEMSFRRGKVGPQRHERQGRIFAPPRCRQLEFIDAPVTETVEEIFERISHQPSAPEGTKAVAYLRGFG